MYFCPLYCIYLLICLFFHEKALQLSPDVAGATFLAAGSSAPELFTSIGDSFGPGNSIGMGTIVGSAMFNILVIVALSAFVAARSGASLLIDWKPVTRDVAYYSSSIILLAAFFMDGKIYWWESFIMIFVYGTYIFFMIFNQTILSKCGNSYKVTPDEKTSTLELEKKTTATLLNDMDDGDKVEVSGEGVSDPDAGAGQSIKQEDEENQEMKNLDDDEDEDDEDDEDLFEFPDDTVGKILHVITLPFLFGFYYTIPQVGKEKWKEWYWMAFFMSILWIGFLCHFMVDFATRIACTLHISPVVMGVLVLAVGTSVPDAIGSMIAAREGEADMAIANAVGSNVFDVLLGLGFPWCLKSLVDSFNPIIVDKDGVLISVMILFFTVFIFVGVLIFNKWKMTKQVGIGLFAFYILYVIYTIISAAISGK